MPGPMELILILIIVMVLFGGKRLPGLGESLGKGIRNFKDAIGGEKENAASDANLPTEDKSDAAKS